MPKVTPPKKYSAKSSSRNNGKAIHKNGSSKKFEPKFSTDVDTSLKDLFISGLREAYWSENHLVKAIPKMIAAAGDSNLKAALQQHLKVTKTHAARLEEAFGLAGEKIVAKKCAACEGLTISGENLIENTSPGTQARETGIILSALKVENFEITTYKGLIHLAAAVDKSDIADLLEQNLNEEEEASNLLTEISESAMAEPA